MRLRTPLPQRADSKPFVSLGSHTFLEGGGDVLPSLELVSCNAVDSGSMRPYIVS